MLHSSCYLVFILVPVSVYSANRLLISYEIFLSLCYAPFYSLVLACSCVLACRLEYPTFCVVPQYAPLALRSLLNGYLVALDCVWTSGNLFPWIHIQTFVPYKFNLYDVIEIFWYGLLDDYHCCKTPASAAITLCFDLWSTHIVMFRRKIWSGNPSCFV